MQGNIIRSVGPKRTLFECESRCQEKVLSGRNGMTKSIGGEYHHTSTSHKSGIMRNR